MDSGFQAWIDQLGQGCDLGRDVMRRAIDEMMRGEVDDEVVRRFLLALREKGETVEEIAGAAESLRSHMISIPAVREGLVDTCGTGGDRSGTFNISTAAAIVAAASGVPIAKHGNRSVTSRTGSADVLSALGVRIDLGPESVARSIEEIGIGFCYAPRFHPAMKHVAAIRRSLGVATIFNLLGPLCNPVRAPFQLIGVGNLDIHARLAQAVALLGIRRAFVVHGRDGLDEVTTDGATSVWEIHDGSVSQSIWEPEQFGVVRGSWNAAVVNDPEASAAVIRRVLAGETGVARDLVVLNAAVAVALGRESDDWNGCRESVEEAIDSGAAARLLDSWIEVSRS